MKKLRTLPVFTIHGIDFMVDIDKEVLREAQRPSNEISFVNDMQDHGTFYRLLYNLDEQRPAGDVFNQNRVGVVVVEVPQLVALDPEGMAEKYGLTVDQLKDKTDFEVVVDQEALKMRHDGKLPMISIAGEPFTVDLYMHELRHAQHFHPVISLRSMNVVTEPARYEAFYHLGLRQVVEMDTKLLEFPDGVVKIRIPHELALDPVAAAAKFGMDERDLLRRYPIQKEYRAEIIPLSETNIPALIQRNKEALRTEHEAIAKRIRPGRR